jgi:hypothetical protein
MGLSITYLMSAIEAGEGITLASQYLVFFNFPKILQSGLETYKANNLSIMCQSVQLGGREVASIELPVYGPPVQMPYQYMYGPLAMSFTCTANMAQRTLFERWHRYIIDPTCNYVNYYDNYIAPAVEVCKLDQNGYVQHRVFFEEVYPKAIMEQELGAANNEALRLNILFAYKRWRSPQDKAAAANLGMNSTWTPEPPGPDVSLKGEKILKDDVFSAPEGFGGAPMPTVPGSPK